MTIQTKYTGIEMLQDEHGWYVFADNGCEWSFDNKPSDADIDECLNSMINDGSII